MIFLIGAILFILSIILGWGNDCKVKDTVYCSLCRFSFLIMGFGVLQIGYMFFIKTH